MPLLPAGEIPGPNARTNWRSYLAGGALGVERLIVSGERGKGDMIKVFWKDGHESEFSGKWLQDHSSTIFNPETLQREVSCFV